MGQRSPLARSRVSRSLAAPVLAGIAFALAGYEVYGFILVHSFLSDYRAFWCAASVVLHGGDPYRAVTLAVCERAATGWGLYFAPPGLVVPAPIPPYAIALFVPLAMLDFPVAAVLWFCSITSTCVLSVVLLSRFLRVTPVLAAWCLLLPATLLWLPYGELTPFALLGALLAAAGLQTGRNVVAIAGLALLAVAPHLALGAWIGAALFVPRARLWIAAAGALLIGLSALVHPYAIVEYMRFVLPVHALAEVPRPAQYSATWIAYALGVRPNAAIVVGEATYIVFLFAGLTGGRLLQRRWNEPAALVLAPLAAAVIGGTFVHASQIALALPFAALFTTREQGSRRTLGAIALAILAVPWGGQAAVIVLGVIVAAAVVFAATANSRLAFRVALAATALTLALLFLARHPMTLRRSGSFPVAQSSEEVTSAPWGRYIWREQSAVSIESWLAKAPTWCALLLLVYGTATVANKEPIRIVRIDQAPIVQ